MKSELKGWLKQHLKETHYSKLCGLYWKAKKKNKVKRLYNRFEKFFDYSILYPIVYLWHSRKPFDENKVLMVEPSKPFSNNYYLLYQKLSAEYHFDIHVHLLRNFFVSKKEYKKRCLSLIRDMATAKYIFFDEGCNAFGKIRFRPESRCVQIWHACGAFKKFGFSTAELLFGDSRKGMERYPYYRYFNLVSVSSPEVIWAYSEAMGLEKEKILPLGVSRTDVFFDSGFAQKARNKLEALFPSARGKKVILFAPTFRGRVACAATSTEFSIPQFYSALSDQYVIAVKHHPYVKEPPSIPGEYADFAIDVTNRMEIDELLCVADICISDYSSVIFEFALFERPMLFFAYDLDEYFDWRGFYYDYYELAPGPVCRTNHEMIDYIQNIEARFDRQQIRKFRERFMAACDGNSTERIIQYVFGGELAARKNGQNTTKE